MNLMKRVAIGATAFAGIATMGVTAVQAAANTATGNPVSGLVSAIATKFNLSVSDVQAVFDAQRAEQGAQMQARHAEELKTRLAQAVTAGKLTQAQADAITAKLPEIRSFMNTLKDKTPAERETAIKTQLESVKAWAAANGIPEQYLELGRGFMGGRGPGGFGGETKDSAARLTQAVTDGKLTQAQADLMTAKLATEKTFKETLKDMTPVERETALTAHRAELKAWATANGIPENFVLGLGGRGGHGVGRPEGMKGVRGGFGGGRGQKPMTAPNAQK